MLHLAIKIIQNFPEQIGKRLQHRPIRRADDHNLRLHEVICNGKRRQNCSSGNAGLCHGSRNSTYLMRKTTTLS